MSKPIEPGCLVVIISADNPEIVGKVGTVVGHNESPFVTPAGQWVAGVGWWDVDADHDCIICRPASSLLRIDGGEDESVTERHDEEVEA